MTKDTTSSETQPQQQEGPARIQINNGSGVWEITGARMLPCPENNVRVEYVRADLPRATAPIEDAARLADEYARRLRSINNHAVAAGVEVLAKEIRELAPRG